MTGEGELVWGPREKVALGHGAVWGLLSVWTLLLPAQQRERHRREAWVFRSLGVLMAVAGGTLVAAALRRRVTPELKLLGQAGAAALAVAGLAGILRGRLSRLHLVDVAAQLALIAGWSLAGPPLPEGVLEAAKPAATPVTRTNAEDLVTEASMESFPASDPPAYIYRKPGK